MPRARLVGAALAVLAISFALPLLLRALSFLSDRPWSICGVRTATEAEVEAWRRVMAENGTQFPFELGTLPPPQTFMEQYIARGRPVVVRGGVTQAMPRVAKWTPQYFAKKWPGMVELAYSVAEEPGTTMIVRLPMPSAVDVFHNDSSLESLRRRVREATGYKGDIVPYWNEQGEVTCDDGEEDDEDEEEGFDEDFHDDDDGYGRDQGYHAEKRGNLGSGDERIRDDGGEARFTVTSSPYASTGVRGRRGRHDEDETAVAAYRRARRWVCRDMDDVPYLDAIRGHRADIDVYFWMGPAGATTGTHYDVDPVGLLHQVYGDKIVWLWPPWEALNLGKHVGEKYEPGGVSAGFNPFRNTSGGDPEEHLRAEALRSRGFRVHLRGGDLLHIPHGWWHAVRSLTPTLSFAARTHTRCTLLAATVLDIPNCLHQVALYTPGNGCTCHGVTTDSGVKGNGNGGSDHHHRDHHHHHQQKQRMGNERGGGVTPDAGMKIAPGDDRLGSSASIHLPTDGSVDDGPNGGVQRDRDPGTVGEPVPRYDRPVSDWREPWREIPAAKRLLAAYLLWLGRVSEDEICPENVAASTVLDMTIAAGSGAWKSATALIMDALGVL